MRQNPLASVAFSLVAMAGGLPLEVAAQNTASARFSVATSDGYVHASLRPQNVSVMRDGQPLRVVSVQSPDTPLTTTVLLENDQGLWDAARAASPTQSLSFLVSQKDWIALVEYGNFAAKSTTIIMDFTQDASALSRVQLDKFFLSNPPKLFDAIKDTASRVSAINGRKALVVLTDGCDASQTTFEELAQQVKNAQQLTVSIVDFGRAASERWKGACRQTSQQLSAMAASTNGEYASITLTDISLGVALQSISHALHNQYVVTYADDARDRQRPPDIAVVDDAGNPYSAEGKAVSVIAVTDAAAGPAKEARNSTSASSTSGIPVSSSSLASNPQALRFAVAHQHLTGWCFGYLYVTPDVISYLVTTPAKESAHGFTFKRSQMTSIGAWMQTNAVEIKFGKSTYHFWWMPNEEVVKTGRPFVWNPPDAADPQQLIAIVQNPETAHSSSAESTAAATASAPTSGDTSIAGAQPSPSNSGGAPQSQIAAAPWPSRPTSYTSTAPPDEPAGANRLSGVYAGMHFGYGPGSTATGEVKVFAFYPDGRGMYLPEEGLDNFDLGAAVRRGWEPINYGMYQFHDNHVDFRSQDGTAIGIDVDPTGSAPGPNTYMKVCHCNGMRFAGMYYWGDRSLTITFLPDGRFADRGAMHDAFQYNYYQNPRMVNPGVGTYRVVDYSIYLDYADGRHLKQSFVVLAQSASPAAVWIRGATFNRLQ